MKHINANEDYERGLKRGKFLGYEEYKKHSLIVSWFFAVCDYLTWSEHTVIKDVCFFVWVVFFNPIIILMYLTTAIAWLLIIYFA